MSRLPILGTAYAHGRTEVTARTAKNIWFEPRGADEKAPVIATHLPKRTTFDTVGTFANPIAFIHTETGYHYIVTTTTLYRIVLGLSGISATYTFPSALTSGYRLDFSSDTTTIVMVQFNKAFSCAASGSTPVEITISGESPVSTAWLRGYFVILCRSGRLYWSTDGLTWNALDFANAEASPDEGVKVMAVGNLLVIFGTRSIEYWSPTGNPDLPFQPITETVAKVGVPISASACMIDGQPFFWGSPGDGPRGLFTLEGSNPVRLSSPDFERNLLTVNAPWVSGFSLAGHKIITVHVLGQNRTWWWDASTGAPTEIPTGSPYFGIVDYMTDWASVHGLSHTDANRFVMDPADYDTAVARELVTDNISTPDLDRFSINKVRLDVAGSQNISLECSRDGGATWGSVRTVAASAGEGVKGTASFDRYGTANQFTFRLKATGKFVLSNMMVNPKN